MMHGHIQRRMLVLIAVRVAVEAVPRLPPPSPP